MVAKQVGKLELEMETWVNERNRPKHSRIQVESQLNDPKFSVMFP